MTTNGNERPVRVLSLDGGGIRGYAQVLLLQHLEAEMRRPLSKMFDVVAGTSIGALVGAGLVRPLEDGESEFQAKEIAMEFRSHGRDIFDFGRVEDLLSKEIPLLSKKVPSPFRKLLTSVKAEENDSLNALIRKLRLDDFKLGEATCEFIAPAYDVADPGEDEGEAVVIFTRLAAQERGEEVTLGTVARASSAAPLYFPPEKVEWNGRNRALIDGGIFANNPSMIALTQVWAKDPHRPVRILSIGTGSDADRGVYKMDETGDYSAPNSKIVLKAVSLMLEATSQAALSLVRDFQEESGSGVDLLSLQPQFSGDIPGLDEADDNTMERIEETAHSTWDQHGEEVVAWVKAGL